MIKLIICDLDGTLLPRGEEKIPTEIINLIKLANTKKICFSVASGRSYHELKGFFDDSKTDIVFVPSDGALIVQDEKTFLKKSLQRFAVKSMVDPIVQNEKIGVVLTGKYISYIISKEQGFTEDCRKKLRGHLMEISGIEEIPEDIYKVSFYGEPTTVYGKKILSGSFSSMSKLIYKNNGWTEFISSAAGKEAAVGCMARHLKVSPSETVVIGDGMNDIEILKFTENSFAVCGGDSGAISAAKHTTDNVAATLNEIIRKGDI